jgi:hypothetical protein
MKNDLNIIYGFKNMGIPDVIIIESDDSFEEQNILMLKAKIKKS